MRDEKKDGTRTHLLAAIFLTGQLHFAHTPSADGLAQDPLPRLRRNGGPRPRLLAVGGM